MSIVFHFDFKLIRFISCMCAGMLGYVSPKKEEEEEELSAPPVRIIPIPVQPVTTLSTSKVKEKVTQSLFSDLNNHFSQFQFND